MKNFNYINREYVNPVDLNVLGKTYDTLEQGHQEAVKAASDLEVSMANLDLNEAESEWRQQKIAQIKQTVADNTNYGNAYGALDDIIATAGNIASDQGMIGRLQAQKDYKSFRDNLDKRQDLPEDYKDYFKEKNPYAYQDKIDERTNTIIGGTKWQPATAPTAVVPLNQVIDQGLKWAAKQTGGGEVTRWIDSSGAITNDPSKAFDGQVYSSTSGQWETLSKDKIRQGIAASIASTPGAKESLAQDYNVATWNHQKQVAANDGKPVASDVTDKNGILLNPDQYLMKRIDPAVQSNAYYNSINKTSYGQGLVTYKAAARAAASASSNNTNNFDKSIIAGRNTPVDVPIDAAASFVSTKNIAGNQIKDIYKKITGNDLAINNSDPIGNMEQLLNQHQVPVEARQQLRTLVKTYNEGVNNFKAYTDKMTPEDKANFDFVSRIKSGGELKSSANGGSKSDDAAIALINQMYGNKGSNIEVTLSDDNMKSAFLNAINGGQFNGYKNLGISVDNNKITIPKSAMNSIPLIFDALEKAKGPATDAKNKSRSFLENLVGQDSFYSVKTLDDSNNVVNDNTPTKIGTGTSFRNLGGYTNITNLLTKADDVGKQISNKYKLQNESIQLSSLNLDGKSFTEGMLVDKFNQGLLNKAQLDVQKKYLDDSFDRVLSNTDFSQSDMYRLADGDNTKKRVVDGAERYNYGSQILQAVKDKRVTVSPSFVPGINDPVSGAPIAGYNITVLPEKVSGKDSKAQPQRFYLPGLVNETASQLMMQDPKIQAFNAVSIAGGTKSTRALTDNNVNPKLGNISITGLGNNNFELNFNGIRKQIRQEDAVDVTAALNNYNAVKNRVMAESHGVANYQLNGPMRSTIANTAITVGKITGTNPNAVLEKLIDDINK